MPNRRSCRWCWPLWRRANAMLDILQVIQIRFGCLRYYCMLDLSSFVDWIGFDWIRFDPRTGLLVSCLTRLDCCFWLSTARGLLTHHGTAPLPIHCTSPHLRFLRTTSRRWWVSSLSRRETGGCSSTGSRRRVYGLALAPQGRSSSGGRGRGVQFSTTTVAEFSFCCLIVW